MFFGVLSDFDKDNQSNMYGISLFVEYPHEKAHNVLFNLEKQHINRH